MTFSNNQETTDWKISTDIYDTVDSVNKLKKRYVDDEDESTLATGIFGFIGDTEAKKIQSAILTTGVLGNEMFPQRAKLDKNVVTHAMYCGVTKLDAVPAHMYLNIGIREVDFEDYAEGNRFFLDRRCPIFVGEYEFHFDYDIVITRSRKTENTPYFYNAVYDMEEMNYLSDIRNPYLRQPYLMRFNNENYIFFQAVIRQVTLTTISDKMITASLIDNKSFTFTFDNQMAHFDVYITEKNKTTRLRPLLYGSPVELGTDLWCWYLYINDHMIRVGFDQTSFLPGLNANIKIEAQTTLGAKGNFNHKMDIKYNTFFVDFESPYYKYHKVTCYGACATDSTDGENRKSIAELRRIVPKMALSRGYITTETDLNNFFNLISTETNRLKLQKKVDNQLNRIWYCYLLMKDALGNVIPTNTVNVTINPKDGFLIDCEDEEGRKYIPAGTLFRYNKDAGTSYPVKSVPETFSEDYFKDDGNYYYRSVYNIIINEDPLYCAYYMPIVNMDGYFEYQWVNPDLYMGFVVTSNHFERYLLSQRNEYRLTFTITQSIGEDCGLCYERLMSNGNTEIVNNMKIFLVIFQDGDPYRYQEATLVGRDEIEFSYDWQITLHTDDDFDSHNRIKLLDLGEIGQLNRNYGYFEENCKAAIYIYGKFDEEFGIDGSDAIIPASLIKGYSLINIYNIADGLSFFTNFTMMTNTRIRENVSENRENMLYEISGVPLIGEHYFTSEENVTYYVHEIIKKKAYIDYCLTVLENNMDIDFKFYNTYGWSKTYHEADREKTSIGNTDLELRFRVLLRSNNDISTKKRLIQYIKDYIEDINNSGENLHFSNLLHDIKEDFEDLIIYIEYMNFNQNRLGINHIELRDVDDPKIVPEFINVRNVWNDDKTALVPCIDLEIVQQ